MKTFNYSKILNATERRSRHPVADLIDKFEFVQEVTMKRSILIILVFVISALLITGCSKDKENGTYYPNASEMQENLEKSNYAVSVAYNSDDNYIGTHLYAEKDNEYIEFYWLNDSKFIDVISEELETKYSNYDKFVSIKDDSKFGTLIFCGTESAVKDAGIKIVDVKVKI